MSTNAADLYTFGQAAARLRERLPAELRETVTAKLVEMLASGPCSVRFKRKLVPKTKMVPAKALDAADLDRVEQELRSLLN